MLNEFKLFARVNESIENGMRADGGSYETHPFTGLDVIEAMDEASRMLIAEQTNVNEFIVGSDEIMVEAVLGTGEGIGVLSESILSSATNMLGKVVKKLIAMVQGLIAKIKAFFAKFTGNTNRWVELMERKINDSKATDVKYTMYQWDTSYLDSFGSNIEKIKADWEAKWSGNTYTGLIEKARAAFAKYNGKESGADTMSFEGMDDPKKALDQKDDVVVASVTSAMGCDGTTLNEALNSIVKKARGGAEKIEQDVVSNKGAMLAYVKGASKGISALEKCYTNALTALKNFDTAINKTSKISFEGEGEKNAVANAARTMLGDHIKAITSYTTAYHTAINQIGRHGTSLISDCAKEYMGALTKIAGGKAPKEEKPEKK